MLSCVDKMIRISEVLERIGTFFSNRNHLFSEFLQKKHAVHQGLCGVSVTSKELMIVYANKSSNKTQIELCEAYPNNNISQTLSKAVKINHLKGMACSWILQPEDYQLLVTDALPVSAEEFQAAIRWKIKDLLHFSTNDVVIDSFVMPKSKIPGINKIMVVAAQASQLQKMSDQFAECGLNLKIIDIPELALRNISALYEQNNASTAFIYVQDNLIHLLITAQKELFISRRLMLDLNKDESTLFQDIEKLTVEIQRSFGYYQNQWLKDPPSQVIFASTKEISNELTSLLSQNLNIPVKLLKLEDIMTSSQILSSEEQGKYLPLIGGLLREEMSK